MYEWSNAWRIGYPERQTTWPRGGTILASFARSILAVAPMAILAADDRGRVQSANTAADEMFGAPLVSIPSQHLGDILIGLPLTAFDTRDGVAAFNARERQDQGGFHRLRRVDGGEVPVDVQIARFEDEGRPFLTLYIQDVSSVLAAEARVQELQLQLVNNWRLNSLGEMATMLAHELNQPLSAVANNLHGIGGLLSDEAPDTVRAINLAAAADAQIDRAREILIHMRKLAVRDTGHYAHHNVSALLREIMPILELNALATGAVVELDVGAEDTVHGDRVQLQQLVGNLVRNALDAPETASRRRVVISGRALPASAYAIAVSDNGPGIAPEIAPRLFEPMTSTKPQGMGLGLSICQTIARAHDGRISHASGPDGGATFTVTLNVSRTAQE